MQEEGYVAKILMQDGAQEVPVGKAVLVICDSAADVAAFASYTASGGAPAARAAAPAAAAPAAAPAAAAKSNYPSHTALAMPALSPTMTAGNIATMKVKVGDKLAPGDLICDIETDKATIGWESQEDGYVAAILVKGEQQAPSRPLDPHEKAFHQRHHCPSLLPWCDPSPHRSPPTPPIPQTARRRSRSATPVS